jgi:hypothetical protein
VEAVEKTQIVEAIFQNPHRKQNLNKEEADKVGELLGQVESNLKTEVLLIVPVFELTCHLIDLQNTCHPRTYCEVPTK